MTFKLIQIFIALLLASFGLLQTIIYIRIKKVYDRLPVVAAEITGSRLLHQLDLQNIDITEAIIHFKYHFRGKEYESNTPVLRGYELSPDFEFEHGLVKKYRPGDIVNARVVPSVEGLAYLEVAPLSKRSTILAPSMLIFAIGIGIAAYMGWFSPVMEFLQYHINYWFTV